MRTLPVPKISIIEYAGRGSLMMRYTPEKGPAVTRSTQTTDWPKAEQEAEEWAVAIQRGMHPG